MDFTGVHTRDVIKQTDQKPPGAREARPRPAPAGLACVVLVAAAWLINGCGEPPVIEPPEVTDRPPELPPPPAAMTETQLQAVPGAMRIPDLRAALPPDAPKDAEIVTDITPGTYGGEIVFALVSDPASFNPFFPGSVSDQFVTGLHFLGLIGYDWYKQKDKPELAKSWAFNEETLEWTFELREGILWSDGHPLTAGDFLFFTEIMYDFDISSDERYAFMLGTEPDSPRYEFSAPDDHTFVAKIPEPNSFSFMTLGLLRALPRHVLEKPWKEGRFEDTWGQSTDPSELVVSGPFKLKELRPEEAVIFERNPQYWRFDAKGQRLPYVDRFVALVVESTEAMAVRFLAGDTDLHESVKPDNLAQFQDVQEEKGFKVIELGPSLNSNYYWFNLSQGGSFQNEAGETEAWQPSLRGEKPPPDLTNFIPFVDPVKYAWFSQAEFRIACSEATHRRRIIDTVLFGLGTPLYSPVPSSNRQWHNPDIPRYAYDPESAKARLEKIGMIDRDGDGMREDADGNPVRFTIVSNRKNDLRQRVLQLLKEDLRAVGLEVETQVLLFNNLIPKLTRTFDYDACLLGLGTGVPPHPSMGANTWKSSGGMHNWYPEQKSPMSEWEEELDEMYLSLQRTFSLDEQRDIFFKMQDLYARQSPTIQLFNISAFVAAKNNIGNLKPTIIRTSVTHNLEELYLTDLGN